MSPPLPHQAASGQSDPELWYVIGSGPTGVACAKALLDAGRRVRMLDAGLTLEAERLGAVERLRSHQPKEWAPADVAAFQAGMNPDVGGVPLKLVYGSDFAYREADERLGIHYDNVGLRPSLAKGGLSNVWGAAMMPYLERDLAEWPFRLSDLSAHYRAVLEFTGLAAARDDLEALFPLYTDRGTELKPSRQSEQVLGRMERNREALGRAGIRFGRSRLAVNGNPRSAQTMPSGVAFPLTPALSHGEREDDGRAGNCSASGESPRPAKTRSLAPGERARVRGNSAFDCKDRASVEGGCVYCRLCMYGCPYGYIYTAADTVAQLLENPNFSYEPGVIVEQVRESAQGVEVLGYYRATGAAKVWRGERVFLAAGAIPTTRILLRSLGAYDQTVWLKDSQYFLLPLILLRRVRGATREWLHALSQVFLEVSDPDGHSPTAHIQVYSNNDLISQAIANTFGLLRRPLAFLVKDLQERMLVAQGYLHSQHSSRIAVTLRRDPATGKEGLELRAEVNPAARQQVKRLVYRLCRQARRIGAMPVPPMLKVAEPGRSFHSGGSFPMAREPRGFQTDLLGRPPGWSRVHAVDATVFPSIPATTITFSAMANAHRIGWEAGQLG